MMFRFLFAPRVLLTAAISCLSLSAMAQQAPDAGRSVQEIQQQQPDLPQATQGFDFGAPASTAAEPGGAQITLRSVVFSGNTVFSDSELQSVLGNVAGRSFDLAGLKGLADRITQFYRDNGYAFARALIPAQEMDGGNLEITVIEGRYGRTSVVTDDPKAAQAQSFLDVLTPGTVIEGRTLERATLILDDQPGYTIRPVMKPGTETGTGDLMVQVERDDPYGGGITLDNHGNRYTGRGRANADLYANSTFLFGDQFRLNGIYTQEDMWFGSAAYALSLGTSGLRASVAYSHTYYELGKEFSALEAHGTAKIASAGLSYPIIRSQKGNLSVSAQYQHKWLTDEQDIVAAKDKKTSDSLPITMNFDRRDSLLGGGITYGLISWTHGILDLDDGLAAVDAATLQTNGAFDKFNLDIARLQNLPAGFQLFGRFAGQLAADNLDSSEGFGLGGANGVRAYPSGEGYGDEGWLGQIELRYNIDAFTPYAFYDAGRVKINNDPFMAGVNHRSIGGAGAGLRINWEGWKADANLAWRTYGGDPDSDSKDETPRVNVSLGYRF